MPYAIFASQPGGPEVLTRRDITPPTPHRPTLARPLSPSPPSPSISPCGCAPTE